MKVVLDLENERTLLDIERLRGALKPEEFVAKCFVDGLRLANQNCVAAKAPRSKDGSLCLGLVAPRFRSLGKDAVRRAVMASDKNDPVYVEVTRLVEDYRRIFDLHRMETGHELHDLQTIALAPIQQVAVEIAVNSLPNNRGFATVREVTKH